MANNSIANIADMDGRTIAEKAGSPRTMPVEPVEPAESSTPEIEYPKNLKLVAIIVAVSLAIFLVSLDMTIIATAIPRITDEFHSLDQVGWYGSAFFLTLASFQSTWGKAYKYFPLKTAFLTAIGIFEVGSLICGVCQNSVTLIVGRAIAGLGGAGIASGVYTITAFSAPPSKVGAFTGILGATYGLASVIGPLLGGVLTDRASWRWCFYINLPIGGLSAVILFFVFKAPSAAKPVVAPLREKLLQMDFPGTFTLMAAFICLLLALQWGGVLKPWGDKDVIGTFVGFGLLIIVFVFVEWRQGERALLMPRLLKQKTIIFLSNFQFFNSGAFIELLYYLPIYFQVVSGVSAAESGVRTLPFILGITFATIVSGTAVSGTGHYIPFMVLGSFLTTVGAGLVYTLDVGSPSSHWIGYQALAGIGIGLGIQVPVIVGQAIVQPTDVSSITAIMVFFQSIGGAVAVSAGQSMFTNRLIQTVPQNAPGIEPALVIATGATALRSVFNSSVIPGLVKSFLEGLQLAYALVIGLAGVATLTSLAALTIDRRNIKQERRAREEAAKVANGTAVAATA